MPEQLSGDREALRLAWDEASDRDMKSLAEDSRASVEGDGTLRLRLMDRWCVIDIGSRDISYADDMSKARPHIQVLALHYLLGAGRGDPTGDMVTFREFPGGALYYPAYKKRTLDILVSRFGGDLDSLRGTADRLGATSLGKATVGFRTMFFPKIAVDTLMWAGDDEVPSSANILFDSCASRILSTEDVTVVAGTLCSRLVALSKA